MTPHTNLNDHYASEGIRQRLDKALNDAGLGSGPIEWSQLVQLDQFHSKGLEAARELAHALGAQSGESVLDLGSGLGGPARFLAATAGCHVTGVELTQAYVDISTYLTQRTGLQDKVTFLQGDAAQLTFADESFDHAWTIHVSMNIQDKDAFYKGVHRVLRHGGRFAIYDVLKGDTEPALYPSPWSPVAELSFLASGSETESLLKAAGFSLLSFEDDSQPALNALVALLTAPAPDPNAPKIATLPQLIGPQVRPMVMNMAQNLREGRTRVVRAIVRKD